MDIIGVQNWDDFTVVERAAKDEAAARTAEAQKQIKPGDFYKRETGFGFDIYGEILEAPKPEMACGEEGSFDLTAGCKDCEDREYCESLIEEDFYKTACPDGELGDVHISTMSKISKEEFEEAKERRWENKNDQGA
jgi:hypothetical protein